MKKNHVYSQKTIAVLNASIKKYFSDEITYIQPNDKIARNGMRRMIMLDRYSQKDDTKISLGVHDVVITTINTHTPEQTSLIGVITKMLPKKRVEIKLDDDYVARNNNEPVVIKAIKDVEKPLELFWEQIAHRVSKSLANIEETASMREKYEPLFYDQLEKLKFIPAGRILFGAGSKNDVTLFNCFVMPFMEDSKEGISDHRKQVMQIMSRGGGVGTNGSTLRPRNAIAKSVGGRSSGAVSWLNDISSLTHLVQQGGSRRGAQMIMLGVWHPDIIEFIVSKMQKPDILKILKNQAHNKDISIAASRKLKTNPQYEQAKKIFDSFLEDDTKEISGNARNFFGSIPEYVVHNPEFLSGANISIAITHDFMKAVKEDADWDLCFPDIENYTESEKAFYDSDWKKCGDPREWESFGMKLKVYNTIKARDLWELILFCATFSAEPGVFFIDTANDYTNAKGYGQRVVATNPCGEQPLAAYSVCNLGAINLTQFVDKQTGELDEKALKETTALGVRMLDNVIDRTSYFLEANKLQAKGERRLGLGIMGLGDMMIWAKKRYGSKEGNKFAGKVMKIIALASYNESIQIAKEKGSFPFLDDREKFTKSKFIASLGSKIQTDICQYGIRNSHLLTVAPTGTTGTMANVSTGLEPNFSTGSHKRSGRLGQNIDMEVDITTEFQQMHPNLSDEEMDYILVGANELSADEHTGTQVAIQKWVDSSISKTVNAPRSYKVKDVEKIYMTLYDNHAKGGTVYVDGSREGQVLSIDGEISHVDEQKQISGLNLIKDDAPSKTQGKRFDRQDRPIGSELGDLCQICKEGTVILAGGCNTCDNCQSQLKCGR